MTWADPVLPHLISDHAVFQQQRDIHVWGTADAKEKITVTLSQNTASTQADAGGRWSVLLPGMPAGGPFTLKVVGKKTLVVADVMIGEVWVASGQSNMTFAMSGSVGAAEEIPKADYPEIRLFTVPRRVTLSPQLDTRPETWHLCTPDAVKEFSAVAYYFAWELHQKMNIPIGIIESAWPGTAIEEWMSPEALHGNAEIKPILDRWDRNDGNGFIDGGQSFKLEFDDFELSPAGPAADKPIPFSNFDDGSVRNTTGGDCSYSWRDAPTTDLELVSPGRRGGGFALRVSGTADASDDSRITTRYHLDDSPADLQAYSGIRFWVRGSGTFRFISSQPTISDWDDYSTQLLPASSAWTPVTVWFRDLRQDGWGVPKEFTPQSLTGFVIESMPGTTYPARPATGLYEGMIAPLLSYPFRGAIWYQGEGNAWRPTEYRKLLPALIDGWRVATHQPDMQFLIVQLPNHGAMPEQPAESAWAEIREAQLLTALHTPGTGLAVTIDVGDPLDLHPHRKAEVGQRLALWALGTTYHKKITYSGPLFESLAIAENAARVKFTHIGGGLVSRGGPLRGFAIAGTDRKFYWASARVEGDSVVVSSPDVPAPVAVRYAWADSPECNLFNAESLPASPFRTDDWSVPGTK